MASLLVSVPPERLGEVDLTFLDERGTLFVAAVSGDRARIVAVHEGTVDDDAQPFDHDITALLPRLGTSVDELAATTRPQIVPPGDVVLLRYTLGLPVDDPDEPPPSVILRGDRRADELRAAVWADPASDAPRMVYADYLCGRGDPRGELINLQLARGTAEVTAHERRLLRRHALDCTDELRPYLVPQLVLDRGFVVRCGTRPDAEIPPEILDHPAWSTVEDLTTGIGALALSRRLVSAHTLRIGGHVVSTLSASPHPVGFETLRGVRPTGIPVDLAQWTALLRRGGLARLRAVGVDLRRCPGAAFEGFERTALARGGLDQLEVCTPLWPFHAVAIRDAFERSALPLLTIQTPIADAIVWVALARTEHGTRLSLQLDDPLYASSVGQLLQRIAPLSTGLRRIVVEDLGDPANIATRQAELIARLGAMFRDVVARPLPAERLGL